MNTNSPIYKFIEDNCLGRMHCVQCHMFVKHSIYNEQFTCFLLELSEHMQGEIE